MSAGKGKWLSLWLPVAIYIAFIFWLSSSYRPIPGQDLFPQMDKVCHFLEYIPLGLLLLRASHRNFPGAAWSWVVWICFLGALGVGTLDELYQSFVPLKSTSGWDLFSDSLGVSVGEWAYWSFRRTCASTP